ncbi:unnamed protein product [Gadus morhua 'NCC']
MAENVDLTFSFKWSKEHTAQLIKLRGENDELFTGVKHSASVAWGIASIQGQERGEVGNPLLPLGPGLSPWIRYWIGTEAFHQPPCPNCLHP